MYSNSRECLEEYSKSQELWLKFLIKELILNNGNLKDEIIDETYNLLLKPQELMNDETFNSNIEFEKKEQKFYIEKLKHISGVNALKENQVIKFNQNLTVLYGPNGSGKSGYFKILNEIAGGNEEKTILPNIYKEIETLVEVKIKESTNSNEITWNNNTRGVPPFNKISVFDSSYVEGLLKQRASQEALVEPLGLHLFASLIKYIDEIKEKISNNIISKQNEKPIIDYTNFSEEIKNTFLHNKIDDNIKTLIEKKYEFTKENEIKKLEDTLKSLKSTNYDADIKLLNAKNSNNLEMIDLIKEKGTSINDLIDKVSKIINEYVECKKSAKEYQKKIEILKQIPSIETPEWKAFITSAKEYNDLLNTSGSCIYCQNPLNEKSKQIIDAYSDYLNNDIVQKNDILEKEISSLEDKIIKDNFIEINTILKDEYKENKFEELIKECTEKLNSINISLYNSLKNKKIEFSEKDKIDFDYILNKLTKYSEKITEEIKKLTSSRDDKNKEIESIESELKLLLENQSISNQKGNIKQWIKIDDEISKLEKIKSSINTTQISTLSKKAHNQLLTENLKTNFKYELNKLGHYNLNVNLVEAGTSKGVSNTKLVLNKDNKVTDILSEGEQKAVAIAMFLAEISFQTQSYPIVLDDPVTSLDNNVMKSFVARLLELDNQIIIFTHNAYFLSLLETAKNGHICKNMDQGCNKPKGKHIYLYYIKEESNVSKGVVIPENANKSETYLQRARDCLAERSIGYEVTASSYIRLAIEKLIDEKILLNITPSRYSTKNSRNDFEKLKNLGKNNDLIEILQESYGRISGGKGHDGFENRETPLQEKELNDILDKIDTALNQSVTI